MKKPVALGSGFHQRLWATALL